MTPALGRDVATCWLTDKRPAGAVCSERRNMVRGTRYRNTQGIRTLANSMLGLRPLSCPLKMRHGLILRETSPRAAASMLEW